MSGGISFTGIPSQPPQQFTKVSPFAQRNQGHLDDISIELHGNEDGTIPATFQIIFVVCALSRLFVRLILTGVLRLAGNLHPTNLSRLKEDLHRPT